MVCKDLHPDHPRFGLDLLPQEHCSFSLNPGLDRRLDFGFALTPGERHGDAVAVGDAETIVVGSLDGGPWRLVTAAGEAVALDGFRPAAGVPSVMAAGVQRVGDDRLRRHLVANPLLHRPLLLDVRACTDREDAVIDTVRGLYWQALVQEEKLAIQEEALERKLLHGTDRRAFLDDMKPVMGLAELAEVSQPATVVWGAETRQNLRIK